MKYNIDIFALVCSIIAVLILAGLAVYSIIWAFGICFITISISIFIIFIIIVMILLIKDELK